LNQRLNRNGVSIENDAAAIRKLDEYGFDGIFLPSADGKTARILVRPDATRYEIAHELRHYTEWLGNPEAYVSRALRASTGQTRAIQRLYKAEASLAAERYVFDSLKNGRISSAWDRLSVAERNHASWYITDVTKKFHFAKKLAK
jgi:hypothetical protein